MSGAFDSEAFVARLAAVSLPDTFNPYRDVCPVHDSPDSPAIRRANQTAWLAAQLRLRPGSLWVGEAGGYRGLAAPASSSPPRSGSTPPPLDSRCRSERRPSRP